MNISKDKSLPNAAHKPLAARPVGLDALVSQSSFYTALAGGKHLNAVLITLIFSFKYKKRAPNCSSQFRLLPSKLKLPF
jgi:hypothetical protein